MATNPGKTIYCRACGQGVKDVGRAPIEHLRRHGMYEGSHFSIGSGYSFHFGKYRDFVLRDLRNAGY